MVRKNLSYDILELTGSIFISKCGRLYYWVHPGAYRERETQIVAPHCTPMGTSIGLLYLFSTLPNLLFGW